MYHAPCFGMPSVMSTVFRKHATQRFAEFGTIGVPQSAHSTLCTAGPGTNSICMLLAFFQPQQTREDIHYDGGRKREYRRLEIVITNDFLI